MVLPGSVIATNSVCKMTSSVEPDSDGALLSLSSGIAKRPCGEMTRTVGSVTTVSTLRPCDVLQQDAHRFLGTLQGNLGTEAAAVIDVDVVCFRYAPSAARAADRSSSRV